MTIRINIKFVARKRTTGQGSQAARHEGPKVRVWRQKAWPETEH